MGQTLDPRAMDEDDDLRVTKTNDVSERHFLLLARGRFSLNQTYRSKKTSLLVESLVVLGFKGQPEAPIFLTDDEIQDLWDVTPSGNVAGGQAELILNQQIPKFSEQVFKQRLEQIMEEEGANPRSSSTCTKHCV